MTKLKLKTDGSSATVMAFTCVYRRVSDVTSYVNVTTRVVTLRRNGYIYSLSSYTSNSLTGLDGDCHWCFEATVSE